MISLCAGCAFPLSLAPFELSAVSILSLFALLSCLQDVDVRTATWRAYLFGLGMYCVGISWVYVSIHEYGGASVWLSVILVMLFVGFLALISAGQGYLYGRFFKHDYWGILFGFAALWVLQEWFRTWFLSGFPWLFLGYGFLDTWLVNLAPIAGVLGISLAAAITSAALYVLLIRTPQLKVSNTGIVSVVVILLLWPGSWLLSAANWVTPHPDGELSVSLVQGNVDQHTKWQRDMVIPLLNLYTHLSSTEWQSDIIVWPEAAITLFKERASNYLEPLARQGSTTHTTLITGIPSRDPETGSFRNTALALGAGSGSYHKRKLVPFGEFVPMESMLRGLITFFDLPMSHNAAGPMVQEPINAGPWRISTSICYEIVYGELVRNSVENPDLLLTITNDTWFGTSIGPLQHLQMARMRALENGRHLIRGANNGVTAIVDERGVVTASLPQFTRDVLRGKVTVMEGITPYARWGSTPVIMACILLLLASIWNNRMRQLSSRL
jgi:apolipoprotein N-acyltransferase